MDKQEIKELIEQFDKSSLTKFKLKKSDFELSFAKEVNTVQNELIQSDPQTAQLKHLVQEVKSDSNSNLTEVRAPMVGTFYASAEEDGTPFVKIGDKIEAGQIVCIIEAMKMMNEIPAPVGGTVVSIEAENGELMGFDSLLMTLDTEDVS
ncbi:MAG: acetyl-CoA carboxylase biotin carboxyl carrier protein [Clostridiaceae bacterium]|jgi:acetyl-CoA carboxylase biotin carboxyl carrier protein|nr:acetyl-CoA carboxylase biotin carboxyl carrier protein [Bacillota bacterium]NLN51976.1 acetyl-CoA carboxylase biotin carboxyl carrier protein [Clostridiaceae bacterium]